MNDFLSLIAVGFHIYIVLTIIFLLLDNRDTSTTFAWIFVFIFFPVFGQVLYFLIGRNWRHPDRKQRLTRQYVQKQLVEILRPLTSRQQDYTAELLRAKGVVDKNRLLRLLFKNSNSILTVRNNIDVIQDGRRKFDRLAADLEAARHSIHMEYFIWRSDPLTQGIKDILIRKSRSGVKIRILYDAVGSFFLKPHYVGELRAAGVEVCPYYDFKSPLTIHTLNYRNHRKLVVIDGKTGYTGGMNMGQEYVDGGGKFASWRDTHMRVEGESVAVLQSIFLTSWFNTTGQDLFSGEYFPMAVTETGHVPVQITTSGPDSEWESIQQLFFSLMVCAEKSVYIQSPYFIPDSSIYTALQTAALGGLDIKLMMTGVPDKFLPYWSAQTYFPDLLKAGVRIFQYKKGFLHAKTVAVDGELCSIGTANMDMRSFHINYEISTLIYDEQITRKLMADFERDLEFCEEITLDGCSRSGAARRMRNSLARLFAPIL
jgi:cardiolipin synthase